MMVRWSLAPPDCIFQQHTRCARCMFPWKTVFDQSGGKTLWAFQFHFIHFLRALQALITVLQICSFTRQELVSDQAISLLGSSPLGKKRKHVGIFSKSYPNPHLPHCPFGTLVGLFLSWRKQQRPVACDLSFSWTKWKSKLCPFWFRPWCEDTISSTPGELWVISLGSEQPIISSDTRSALNTADKNHDHLGWAPTIASD